MTSKGCFENQYEDYSPEVTANILNNSRDGISEKFETKLLKFKTEKLHTLTMEMESNIFFDGTVYTGSAGLALFYFMNSLKTDYNPETLKTALEYINTENLKGRRISFLCGDAGPLALATVIAYKLNSKHVDITLPDYKSLAQRLMSLISLLQESPDELLYGKSGYLYALLFVNKHIGKETIPVKHIEKFNNPIICLVWTSACGSSQRPMTNSQTTHNRATNFTQKHCSKTALVIGNLIVIALNIETEVISSIMKSGKQYSATMKSASPLLWHWHEKIYFGAAHGMAGILYMLLQARSFINVVEIRTFIKPAIDWLLYQRFPSGNFPSSMGSSSGDKLVQWCHGAPGFVPLCILAYQIFDEDKYMKIAVQCGDLIWHRGLCTKGYSLCHGVSGNAYAFIQLYQATKKPMYLYQACCFMEWCAVERPGTELHHPDRPASLFEGLVGRLYLAEDITRVLDAKFPAFTI